MRAFQTRPPTMSVKRRIKEGNMGVRAIMTLVNVAAPVTIADSRACDRDA
jgi:hypothetical protein